jgi:hypothetical protein
MNNLVRITRILGFQIRVVQQFLLAQWQQQMFLLQRLIRTWIDVTHKVVKTVRLVVVHFPQTNHVVPRELLVAQLVPPFPPNRFPERRLGVGAQSRGRQTCPVPNFFRRIVSRLRRCTHFVLRFGKNQQRFSIPDLRYVQVVLATSRYTRRSVSRPVEVLEDVIGPQ